MRTRLEHANLDVRDLDEMIRFLTTALPDFRVRGEGLNRDETRWVHLGTDETYLALNQSSRAFNRAVDPYQSQSALNHLAFEVDDVAAVRQRLEAAGYQTLTTNNAHPHRIRAYGNDQEGNKWEFVEYLSDNPLERHDYQVPDSAANWL